ncbi:hypothetical protein GCM10027445_13250 [Amycolatopsis endophytica]
MSELWGQAQEGSWRVREWEFRVRASEWDFRVPERVGLFVAARTGTSREHERAPHARRPHERTPRASTNGPLCRRE